MSQCHAEGVGKYYDYYYYYYHCYCYCYCYYYYYYYYYYFSFIPIAAGRSAWRHVRGSALHRCFKSTRTTWASPATNSCNLATYSTCQENGAKTSCKK